MGKPADMWIEDQNTEATAAGIEADDWQRAFVVKVRKTRSVPDPDQQLEEGEEPEMILEAIPDDNSQAGSEAAPPLDKWDDLEECHFPLTGKLFLKPPKVDPLLQFQGDHACRVFLIYPPPDDE